MSEHIDYDKEAKLRVWHLNKTGGAVADGLTVRDYFAASAMRGFVGSSRLAADVTDPKLAEAAYLIADAMMKEREK